MKSLKKLLTIVLVMAMLSTVALGSAAGVYAEEGDPLTLTVEALGETQVVLKIVATRNLVLGTFAGTLSFNTDAFSYNSYTTVFTSKQFNTTSYKFNGTSSDPITFNEGDSLFNIVFDKTDAFVKGNEYSFNVLVRTFADYNEDAIEISNRNLSIAYTEQAEQPTDALMLTAEALGDNQVVVKIVATRNLVLGTFAGTLSFDTDAFSYNSYTTEFDSKQFNTTSYKFNGTSSDPITFNEGDSLFNIVFDKTDAFVMGNEYIFNVLVRTFADYNEDTITLSNNNLSAVYKEDAPATYQITWKVDGQEDVVTTVNAGETPVYPNGTPTKAADAQYTYTFKAWDPEVVPAAADATYTATWDTTVNKYNIKFVNYDGTVLQEGTVAYGETPAYNGETPTKDPTNTTTYTFKGWDPEIVPVNGDATYTAQYEEAVRKYIITWVIDGSNETEEYEYNATPSHADPVKEGYNFIGWDPQIAPVTADATYTAKFEEKVYYTVTFVDGVTGGTISTVTVESGAAATAPTAPTHEGYTFTGWDKEFSNVTENLTVTAQYTPKTYRLWIYYVDENNEFHSLQAGKYFDIPFGTDYDVAEYIPAEIDGWVFVNTDNPTSGTMPAANVEINAFYHELKAPVVAGEKAELRERETADGKSDIRFIFKVTFNDSCVNYKGELVGPTKDYYEVTGIAAALNAGNSDLTVNGQNIWKMADDSFQYTVVLKSIPESAYDKTITATPNITYVMGNDSATVNGTPIRASVNSVQNVD